MNNSRILGLLLISLTLVSCNDDPAYKVQEKKSLVLENAPYDIQDNFGSFSSNESQPQSIQINLSDYISKGSNITEISDTSSYIVLESTDQAIIGSLDALTWDGQNLFITDSRLSKSVYKYNQDGSFITSIGRNGQGPGEYVNPTNVSVDNGKVYVHSEFQGGFMIYDTDGNYERHLRVPFLFDDFHHLNGQFLFNTYNRINGHIAEIANQMLVSTNSELSIEKVGYYFDPDVFINMTTGFEDRIYKAADELFYIQPFDNTLSKIDPVSAEITPLFRFDFGNQWPDHDELKAIVARQPEYLRQQLMDRDYTIIEDAKVGTNHVLLNTIYKSRLVQLMISRNTGSISGGIAWIDNIDRLPTIKPAFLIGNKMISTIEAPDFVEAISKMDKSSSEYKNLLTKIPQLERIKASDNLILRVNYLK